MNPQALFSPVSLRYIAALRGHKPGKFNTGFAYAEANCTDPEPLTCLAASNPEGRFYGFVADDAKRREAESQSSLRGVFNVVFLAGSPSEILARLENGSSLPPTLDYLCCDESKSPLSQAERTALYNLAKLRLNDGGLFVNSYAPFAEQDGALRFLVNEMAPEMNDQQKKDFLLELNKLGATHLSRHPATATKLKDAIVKADPAAFFAGFADHKTASRTFDTMVAMGERGFAFAGDATMQSNFVELSVPFEAQEIIVQCRGNVMYEPIKDLALDRALRSDIWVKAPFDMSNDPADLFGGFAYGIVLPREEVPTFFAARGKGINLSSPLYLKLIDLMATLPMGIGDFLNHPNGKNEPPEQIIEALQVLVACGIALPMRGIQTETRLESVAQPRLVGSFNRYIDKSRVTGKDVWLASPVLGCGVTVSARDALVMQALNRAGLANSVSALMPELRRVADTPAIDFFAQDDQVTGDMAQKIVKEVIGKSLPQWYAYGLMEAA